MRARLRTFFAKHKSRIARLVVLAFLLSLLYEFSRVETHAVTVRFTFHDPHAQRLVVRDENGEAFQRIFWAESGSSRERAFSLSRGSYVVEHEDGATARCVFRVPSDEPIVCAL